MEIWLLYVLVTTILHAYRSTYTKPTRHYSDEHARRYHEGITFLVDLLVHDYPEDHTSFYSLRELYTWYSNIDEDSLQRTEERVKLLPYDSSQPDGTRAFSRGRISDFFVPVKLLYDRAHQNRVNWRPQFYNHFDDCPMQI